jgi:hypothetical protein
MMVSIETKEMQMRVGYYNGLELSGFVGVLIWHSALTTRFAANQN